MRKRSGVFVCVVNHTRPTSADAGLRRLRRSVAYILCRRLVSSRFGAPMGNNCCSEHRRDPSGGFVVRKFSSVFEKAVLREKALDAESETRLRTSSTYSAATTVSVQSDCGRTDATRQVSRGAGDTYRFQRLPPGFNGDSPMRASPTQSRGSPQIYAVRQPRTMMLESTAPSTPSRAVSPPPTPPRAVDSSCDGPGSVSTPDHKRPNLYSAFKKFAKAARHDS